LPFRNDSPPAALLTYQFRPIHKIPPTDAKVGEKKPEAGGGREDSGETSLALILLADYTERLHFETNAVFFLTLYLEQWTF
jgi:hypothetical protein